MTEDNGPDGFYRYLPNHRGQLHRGGTLQMLCVNGRSKYDTVTGQKVGKKLPLRVGHDRRPRPRGRRAPLDPRLRAGPRQGRRPVHGARGRIVGPGQRLVHGQRGRRHPPRAGLALHAVEEPQARHAPAASSSRATAPASTSPTRSSSARAAVSCSARTATARTATAAPTTSACLTPDGQDGDVRGQQHPARPRIATRARRRARFGRSEWSGRLLQPRRQVAVRPHPDPGHHLRDHRALGEGLGSEPDGSSSPPPGRSRSLTSRSTRGRSSPASPRTSAGEIASAPLPATARRSRPASGAAPPASSPTSRPTRRSSSSPGGRRSSTTATSHEVGPGDVCVLPAGAETRWTVHETLTKVYVIVS